MHVAFDDTDSLTGMCTTFLLTEMVEALRDFDLIGLPRLVRLNPAVPWKTRGNGALCLRVGRGASNMKLIGRSEDDPIYCHARQAKEVDADEVLDRAYAVLKRWSRTDEGASPGLVVTRRSPRPWVYWSAVRGVVEREKVEKELEAIGALRKELAGGRGVIGATAALSWRPRDRTYEILVYRAMENWGKKRLVNEQDVAALDPRFPGTFNNYDFVADKMVIAPHSPCPVLFGIRGESTDELVEAMASLGSETKARWLLFLSNQGTDDHIIRRWKELRPMSSYELQGQVVTGPRSIQGGHVFFSLQFSRKAPPLECAVYEPAKGFRGVVRRLQVGDRIRVMGELRDDPRSLNIEKLEVIALAHLVEKLSNPICSACEKSMQSLGRDAGYRCRRCGAKAKPSEAVLVQTARELQVGWYEPPVSARRHLSKPIKRMVSS